MRDKYELQLKQLNDLMIHMGSLIEAAIEMAIEALVKGDADKAREAVEFDDTISGVDVKHGCFDRHMLITAIGSHIIRMVPPLIVSEEECDKAFDIIKETVESLS